MIKENELRVDNWVKDSRTNTLVQIGGIHVSGIIYVYDKDYDDWKRSIEPEAIPLTHGILEKAGFKQSRGSYRMFWHLEKIEIRFFDSGLAKFKISSSHQVKIESLHQLQNLYFALTGEELSINLNEVVK